MTDRHDRRFKQDASEKKDCPVKTRFTDSEYQQFYSGAQMATDGEIAPFVRECALLGLEMKQKAQDRLLARLSGSQSGDEPDAQNKLMIQAMQDLIRAGLAANAKSQSKAA